MFLNTIVARTASARRKVSHVGLAIALATGGTLASGVIFETRAYAQDRNTKDFANAYQPLADIVNAKDGDFATAKAMIPSVIEKIGNEQDRFTMGNLVFALGQKTTDNVLMRQGLELMLASGKVAPEQIGQFKYFVGSLAYDARDYAAARAALQNAIDAGYEAESAAGLVAESYFAEENYFEGVTSLTSAIDEMTAQGSQAPENWYLRGLQMATQNSLSLEAMDLATRLVKAYPSPQNWGYANSVMRDMAGLEDQDLLDLFRLMLRTDGFLYENDIREYMELADKRGLPGEVLKVLDATETNELRADGDALYYDETREIATGKARTDRAELDEARASVEAAGSRPAALIATGDAYLGYGDPVTAETLYRTALEREGVNTNRAMSRIAIAQIDQGNHAGARETLSQIEGPLQRIANLWLIYLDQLGG